MAVAGRGTALGDCPGFAQHDQRLRGGHRPPEQETGLQTAELGEHLELRLGLDAFGNDVNPQGRTEGDQGAHVAATLGSAAGVDQAPVQFQPIHGSLDKYPSLE